MASFEPMFRRNRFIARYQNCNFLVMLSLKKKKVIGQSEIHSSKNRNLQP